MGERTPRGPGLRASLFPLTGPLRFLLLSSFLIPLGSFMVLPFMSVFLHERLGMGLGTVGVVLAVASLVQFSGGIVGGALADRIGLRRTMLWALVVRTAGFAGLPLDLCCGPGVFTVSLARRGHRVTGVDLSPAMPDRARKRLAGADVTYVRADAREYEAPGGFDVVLNMFTSFGYFEDPADNARVLRTMYTCLAPGGTLVLDLAGKELLARRGTPPKVVRRGDDLMVQTDTVLDEWARLRSEWVLVRGERVTRATLTWFVYSAVGLRRMAKEAGFGRVEVFGGFDGRPYDESAERLVLRAVREA